VADSLHRVVETLRKTAPAAVVRVEPPPTRGLVCAGALRASYRVEDTSLEGYTLYRGVDSEPDLTAAPWETFSTLPHDTAALAVSHTYYFVLRWRNRYGLESQNITSWVVELDGAGESEAVRPSAPFAVSIEPAAGGTVKVRAEYAYQVDGSNQADQWLIYLTNTGVDPNPGVDSPTVVTMTKEAGHAQLTWTSTGQGDGADVRVLVRTRRSSDSVDSDNVDVYATEAETSGPDAVEGGAFLRNVLEEHQT